MAASRAAAYAGDVEVEPFGERSGGTEDEERAPVRGSAGPLGWFYSANHSPSVVEFLRRTRRALPGDPDFGDPLSADGVGGPRAAARVADRLLDREAVSREVSLGALQLWQAVTEKVSGKPANSEVTLVFSDLVGFSSWALTAGDDATLRLLRRVAQAYEPPLLEAGGRIVKRMGDGSMAVFTDPGTAVRAVLNAMAAVRSVEVDGHTPRMRVGVHTGRPQRIGSDWLGVDVNIAARVMERATRGGLIVSQATLDRIPDEELAPLNVTVKRQRRHVFSLKPDGVPPDLAMYRVRRNRPSGEGSTDDDS